MTVVAHLMGGLGNQLFQLAAAQQLARQQGRSIIVDVTEARLVHDRQGILPLYEGLNTIDFTNRRLPWQVNSRQARFRQSISIGRSPGVMIANTDEVEDFIDDGRWPYVHLQGVVMSRELAESACGPDAPLRPRLTRPSAWFDSMSELALHVDPVGVHVRRGDFLQDRARGILRGSYYRKALALAGSPGRPVWVFTDDPGGAARFLGSNPADGFEFLRLPKGVAAADAMMLLSSLTTIIICNSTFSWWAAFLSDAVVAYPSVLESGATSTAGSHRTSMNDSSWIEVAAEYF
jgi:hypothetical protein